MLQTISRPITRVASAALIASALIVTAALTATATPAFAHDELVSRELVADASNSPEAIRLSFNNSIVEVGTEFIVNSADGADVTDGAPVVVGPDVTQKLTADLAPGDYAGAWRVVSSDGHPIEGAFTVVVESDGSAMITDAAPLGETKNTDSSEGSALPVIALIAGGVAIVGGVAAVIVGAKRRSQGMAADAQKSIDSENQA